MSGAGKLKSGRGRRPLAGALGALLLAAAIALPANAQRGEDQTLELSYTGLGAERIKTVPISRRSGSKPRVAMSLSPDEVGSIGAGDAVWAGGEVEVSVTCLERIPQCVGKIYHYSPHVKARLVLAGSAKAAGGGTTPISKAKHLRCSQELPHRNHHCVLAVQGTRTFGSANNLPCDRCHVNLVLDVYHPRARKGQVIVVGTDDDHGIAQNKGSLNAGVFEPGPPPDISPVVQKRSATGRVGVAGVGGSGPKKVIYSRRLDELRAGEQLIITAKAVQKIGHLPYNVLMQSQLVLSEKAGSISRAGTPGKIASLDGEITAQNGFNCTHGRSGHRSPCAIRKIGVVKIFKDARLHPEQGEGPFVPLFVNLVVQNREILAGRSSRHRRGDQVKVPRKAGFLEVRRFGPEFRR